MNSTISHSSRYRFSGAIYHGIHAVNFSIFSRSAFLPLYASYQQSARKQKQKTKNKQALQNSLDKLECVSPEVTYVQSEHELLLMPPGAMSLEKQVVFSFLRRESTSGNWSFGITCCVFFFVASKSNSEIQVMFCARFFPGLYSFSCCSGFCQN